MKKTEITKRAIIDATTELLRANGNVTIKDIAKKADVNIAAINYHFTDKQRLINIVVSELMDKFEATVESFLISDTSNREALAESTGRFLHNFYDTVFHNIYIIKYILSPTNKRIMETSGTYFLNKFSIKSELTRKILEKLSSLNGINSQSNKIKVKYAILFSALSFPLIFNVNGVNNEEMDNFFIINTPELTNLYIEQIISIITSPD